MKLNELLYTGLKLVKGNDDTIVSGVEIDSRKVTKDTMFVCIKGLTVDGHDYIKSAVENGASVIVVSDEKSYDDIDATIVLCENGRETLSLVASKFYGEPTNEFTLIGVTGTNGKTSTTYFAEQILRAIDKKTGVIGTTGALINGEAIEFSFETSTTPDAHQLQSVFSKMRDEKTEVVVMEVTSQGLDQKRVFGSNFDVGVFTNLTQDHLDYHGNMEEYFKAKCLLFDNSKNVVINIDDEYGKKICSLYRNVFTISLNGEADLFASNIEYFGDGSTFDITYDGSTRNIRVNTPGKFTIYNILCAIGALIKIGVDFEKIVESVGTIKGVRGRIESIENDREIAVLVDYAHTPDGLLNICSSVREFTKGRVITVFGCGGDRDRTKRPIMADIASKLSDITIVTSDNPRTEDPNEIVREVASGVDKTKEHFVIVDRAEAIRKAIEIAKKGDSVIVAGKGHEDYQIIGTTKIHFDDAEECKKALGKL